MTKQQQKVYDWAQWEVRYGALWRRIERLTNTGFGSYAEQLDAVTAVGVEAARLREELSKLNAPVTTTQPKNRKD